MRLNLFVTAAAVLAASLVARADTYQYQFVADASDGPFAGTVVFDEPSILSSNTTIDSSSFVSSTNSNITSLFLDPTGSTCPNGDRGGVSCLEEYITNGSGFNGYNPSFTMVGQHVSVGGGETLTITDTTPATVPEPSGFALLGTGVLGVAGMVRKRFAGRL